MVKSAYETPYIPQPARGRGLLIAATLIGLLLYSAAIGLAIGLDRMRYAAILLALPVGVGGLLFLGHYFRTVVLLLPLTALTLPFLEMGTGTASTLPLSLLLTLGLIAIWVAGSYLRGWRLAPSPLNRPLLVFGAICVISLVWGIIWRDPHLSPYGSNYMVVQVGSLVTILASLAAGLLIGNFVSTRRQIGYILGLFIVCGLAMTICQMLRIEQRIFNDRGLWGLWFCAPVTGLLVAQPGLGWRSRAALLGILVLNLYHTMITNSIWVSGWMPSLIGVMTVVFLSSRRLFLALLLVAALLGGQSVINYVNEVTEANVEEGGLERLSLWEQNWRVVSDHWLFGTGPAGYAIYYMTFFREDARSTHNNYLDILAQFGFAGTIAWFWFAGTVLLEGWQLMRRAPPGLLRTTIIVSTGGWLAASAAMMLGDWVLPFAYNQGIGGFKYTVYTWIFCGLIISARQILEREERSDDERIGAPV